MILYNTLTTASWVMFTTSMAFIHLMKVSIPMNKYLNPLGALGRMPRMSIPQLVKGHKISIGRRGFACLLLEELSIFTLLHDFHRVIFCCWPVESMLERRLGQFSTITSGGVSAMELAIQVR
jgi:hypothetical protein